MPGDGVPVSESYRVLRSRIDLGRLAPLSRSVTEHVIAASADFDYATDLVCEEQVLAGAVAALAAGAPVVADTAAVAAGIAGYPVVCKSEETLTVRLARTAAISRPAAAVRLAFGEAGPGAVWLVGGAAAALDEIMNRNVQPALVIGVPSGLVGTAEAGRAARQRSPGAEQRVGEGRRGGGRGRVLRAGRCRARRPGRAGRRCGHRGAAARDEGAPVRPGPGAPGGLTRCRDQPGCRYPQGLGEGRRQAGSLAARCPGPGPPCPLVPLGATPAGG